MSKLAWLILNQQLSWCPVSQLAWLRSRHLLNWNTARMCPLYCYCYCHNQKYKTIIRIGTLQLIFPQDNAVPKICGPWVGNDGLLATHSDAQVGNVDSLFSAEDQIDFVGQNFIIVHLRVGNIQIAIGKSVDVTPQRGKFRGQSTIGYRIPVLAYYYEETRAIGFTEE